MIETKKTLSESVEKYLREQIINGKLQPKEKIVENDIAKELNISRGPVREALRTLMIEGLVEYQPNKGCSVTTLSPKDAYEVFFMRGSLEKLALEKCGGKLSDEIIFKLEVALDDMKIACETNDTVKVVAADEMFHRQIVVSGHMERLIKMWEMLSPLNGAMFLTVNNAKVMAQDIFREKVDNSYYLPGRNAYESHMIMYNVLKQGNIENSIECIDAHYILTGERIYRAFLREQNRSGF